MRPLACVSQWNAYVVQGGTKEQRRERLRSAPKEWQKAIASHVETVWRLKAHAKNNSNIGGFY